MKKDWNEDEKNVQVLLKISADLNEGIHATFNGIYNFQDAILFLYIL